MGSILNAECGCGYKREGLFAGAGMLDFEKVCSAPAFCENCHEVVLADYLAKVPKCPKCKGKPSFYDDVSLRSESPGREEDPLFEWHMDWIGKVFRLPGAAYLCPCCLEKKMRFVNAGFFD